MSVVLDGALPPPHLLQSRSPSWLVSYNQYDYPAPDTSTPSMSPRSLHSYMSRMPESPLPSQELNSLPTSAWYSPSVSAPDAHHETAFAAYAHYVPPHTAPVALSPPTSTYHYLAKTPISTTQIDSSVTALSPSTVPTRESVVTESKRPSEEPQANSNVTIEPSSARWRQTSHLMDRPHSSSSSMQSVPVDSPWPMSPLDMHPSGIHHDHFYPSFPGITRSPRLSETVIELPSNHPNSPQPRRMYSSIAPQPLEIPRSNTLKRSRDDEEDATDDSKRRKRSDSNTSTHFELGEEDKLLLQLKEEESMPWKDIAARFQTDLGKSYQIPALQMRLKRLRERMRVWTEADVRALRMAHEYWTQNKFEIISQKMLEFGAQEKWTARQCARKYAEIEPTPAPYAQFDHLQQAFAPVSMRTGDAPHPFMPYMNVQ